MRQRVGRGVMGVAAGSVVAVALAVAVPVSAGATTTQTRHFTTITNSWGSPSAPPPPTNNSNCPAPVLYDWALLNATGHGVQHLTVNNAGDGWSTMTFTGTATVVFYPASSLTFGKHGKPTGIVGPSDMTVSGHLTDWFGFESNKQNQVAHGTINFRGTVAGTGSALSFHDNAQFVWTPGMSTHGPPTFYVNNATC